MHPKLDKAPVFTAFAACCLKLIVYRASGLSKYPIGCTIKDVGRKINFSRLSLFFFFRREDAGHIMCEICSTHVEEAGRRESEKGESARSPESSGSKKGRRGPPTKSRQETDTRFRFTAHLGGWTSLTHLNLIFPPLLTPKSLRITFTWRNSIPPLHWRFDAIEDIYTAPITQSSSFNE